MTPINYECHVTIAYLTEAERASLMLKLGKHQFRLAKLLFSKTEESTIDTFMSAKSQDFNELLACTTSLLADLRANHPHVRILRYKIEATLIDSKHRDCLHAL